MGCGASTGGHKGPKQGVDGAGLREFLKGLGVSEQAQKTLSKTGIRSRGQLTSLSKDGWREVDAALQKARVPAEDRRRIAKAQQLEMRVPMGRGYVPVLWLQAGDALHTTKSLQRVFWAVGSRAGPGHDNEQLRISCLAFSKGVCTESVPSKQLAYHNSNSSVVHTGHHLHKDVSEAASGLHDRERVYVWFPRLSPDQAECLVLVATALPAESNDLSDSSDNNNTQSNDDNYKGGSASCSSSSGAYARLVNADTNQELCRQSLAGLKLGPGHALVLGKFYRKFLPFRTSGPWQYLAMGRPLAVPKGSEMADELIRLGCCHPPAAQPGAPRKKKAEDVDWEDIPLYICLSADLAEATEDGVSAATKLFAYGSDITRDMVMDPRFETGVKFESLVPSGETLLVGPHDLLPLDAAASVYSWAPTTTETADAVFSAGEAVGRASGEITAAVGDTRTVEVAAAGADAAGETLEAVGGFAAGAGEMVGSGAGAALDNLEVVGFAGRAVEAAGAVEGVAAVAGPVLGAAGGGVLQVAGTVVQGVAAVGGSVIEAVGNVAGALS